MKNRVIALSLLATMATMSCTKDGGRPAPNSVAQPAPAPAAPATPAEGKVPAPTTADGKTTTSPVADPKAPTIEELRNSKMIQYDNGNEPQGILIKDKSFFVNNYDAANLPDSRKRIEVQNKEGKKIVREGRNVTHLSTPDYLACAQPDCLARVSSLEEEAHHAETCWTKSFATELANFKFSFSKEGRLRFIGNISGARYGATNIEYSFNGKSRLYISPFIATAEIAGEVWAIEISAVPGYGLTEGKIIRAHIRTIEKKDEAYKLDSFLNIELGKIEGERFVSSSSRRVIGGLRLHLEPVTAKVFKTLAEEE